MSGVPSFENPAALRAWRDQTLYRRLLRASRAEASATLGEIHARGYLEVSLGDTNLLANLDTGGSTITALAQRAGVTRQAASQKVTALERAGYVTRHASEHDGRAVIVVQTDRGRALLRDALEIVAVLERDYAAALGPRRYANLTSALAALLDHIDPHGTLGTDPQPDTA
jgi:DNA-binding MarR family transcriptional regulator